MERHSQARIPTIEIYTDGSCKKMGTATFGGWAFIVIQEHNLSYKASGSMPGATNQQMELEAIAQSLEYIKSIRRQNEKVIIYSDSAYAINCYSQKWYERWRDNGWINAAKKPVANVDLWTRIIPFFENWWYEFRKVVGHAGVVWNEECDSLAQKEAEHLKLTWRGIQNNG